ncbi:MAG: tyrosine-protein phosphatase [Micrococcales bacterium]|nr:tyrosine-protein phosphatase [Micrococcales bacterium]
MTDAAPTASRDVAWEGVANARDLGGLPLRGGGRTRAGRVFRSARADTLSDAGWSALADAGIRTIVDLRNDNEILGAPGRPVDLLPTVSPLEDVQDPFYASWTGRHHEMDYFRASIDHWPALYLTAFEAVASAPAGGVLIHCAAGRDRTGAVCALLLAAAGVERKAILDDYELGIASADAPPGQTAAVARDARAGLERFLDVGPSPPMRAALVRAAARLL